MILHLERNTKLFYNKDLEVLETFSTCTENMAWKQSLSAFPSTELEGLREILKQRF